MCRFFLYKFVCTTFLRCSFQNLLNLTKFRYHLSNESLLNYIKQQIQKTYEDDRTEYFNQQKNTEELLDKVTLFS